MGTPSHHLNVAKVRLPSSLPGSPPGSQCWSFILGYLKTGTGASLPSPVMPGTERGLSLLPVVPSVVGPVEEGQTDMMPARGGSTYSRGGAFEVGFER